MKKRLLGSLVAMSLAMGFAGEASADWNGLYAGASLGYSSLGGTFYDIDHNYFPSGEDKASRGNGGFVGAQVGYNIQNGNLVYGVEVDMMANLARNARSADGQGCGGPTFDADMKGKGSLRARLGMLSTASDLFFLTGGVAFAAIDQNHFDCDLRGTNSTVYTGWTLGAGWERQMASNLSVRLEADYARYGKETWIDQSDENFGLRPNTITVGAGLNFHF